MQLTVRDVAKLLDVGESTVTRWIKQRGLPAQWVGSQHRFNRAELLEWATANQIKVSLDLFDNLDTEVESPPSLVEALGAGGIFHRLPDTNKEKALRASGSSAAASRRDRPGTAVAALPCQRNVGDHGDRRRHRPAPRPESDCPQRRSAHGHALLSGAARGLRGAGWQAGTRLVLAHLPHGPHTLANAGEAVSFVSRQEFQGRSDATSSARGDPAGGAPHRSVSFHQFSGIRKGSQVAWRCCSSASSF